MGARAVDPHTMRMQAVGLPIAGMHTMGMPASTVVAADMATIGVAIELPQPWADQLQAWRAEFGDPLAFAIPAHITLLPPTLLPAESMAGVVRHLENVAASAAPFELALSGTGTFQPVSPVVYVRVVRGTPGCDGLQQRVRTGPLVRDLAFPYHPHVTVAHELDEAALQRAQQTLDQFQVAFTVDGFCLYEHGSDGVWRPRRRFPFGGAA